jgi:hypothetical protein
MDAPYIWDKALRFPLDFGSDSVISIGSLCGKNPEKFIHIPSTKKMDFQ